MPMGQTAPYPQAPYSGNFPLPPVPAATSGAMPPPSFSSGGGGGVSASMPPPPPDYSQNMQDQQFNDTANQFAPSVNQQDQSQGDQSYDPTQYDSSQAQGDQQPDQAGSDDAGGVAMTNMAETIGGAFKNMFSMSGMGYPVSVHQNYGLGYMYGKTPVKKKDPKKPDYVTAQTTPGIPQSTTTAVMLIGGMAVLAAGAFFIFSRTKKAPVDDRQVRKNRGRRARRLARRGGY